MSTINDLAQGKSVRIRVPTGGVRSTDRFVIVAMPTADDPWVRVRLLGEYERGEPSWRRRARQEPMGFDAGSLAVVDG